MEGNQFVSQPINWAFVIIAVVKGSGGGRYCSHTRLKWGDTHFAFTANWQLLLVPIHFISPQRTQVTGEEQEERENKGDTAGAAQRAPSLTWPDKC